MCGLIHNDNMVAMKQTAKSSSDTRNLSQVSSLERLATEVAIWSAAPPERKNNRVITHKNA